MLLMRWLIGVLLLTVVFGKLHPATRNDAIEVRDFGMNKPHLLFHLGTRQIFSVNYGVGYWATRETVGSDGHYFTELRHQYANMEKGLYASMTSHDGDTHIEQEITDYKYGVRGSMKYQLFDSPQHWQQSIFLERNSQVSGKFKESVETKDMYWVSYMAVENSDSSKIDRKKHSSPITFSVAAASSSRIVVSIHDAFKEKEERVSVSAEGVRAFGMTVNISESYGMRKILEVVRDIIELKDYKNVTRTKNKKHRSWEDEQLRIMRENDHEGKAYSVVIFYGKANQEASVFLTNSTSETEFAEDVFREVSQFQSDNHYFSIPTFQGHQRFLQHMLYNLYGGMAFYFGQLYTQNSVLNHQLDSSFTFTPSRLIFPRAFLWDDGFHVTAVLKENPMLAMRVISNWFRKIDMFGWIGREQIRGMEMGSLMPDLKFIYQDSFQMNPPTLLLPIIALIQMEEGLSLQQSRQLRELLSGNFWRLEKWYRYFGRTQTHRDLQYAEQVDKEEKYRWRCKDECALGNFMGSGLDDYPRTSQQGQISRQHVDLLSWMYLFADSLETIADYLHLDQPRSYYRAKKNEFRSKIIKECLDPEDNLFKDEAVKNNLEFRKSHVDKKGYVSLFPFLAGIHKDSFSEEERERTERSLAATLSLMMNETELLSGDGLRSLSISDDSYGTGENYWRGAVWMPINYLVLRACRKYYWERAEVKEAYATIRDRLISTVKSSWQDTGYLFENYFEGKGNRGYPFYGWTALLINIITEEY